MALVKWFNNKFRPHLNLRSSSSSDRYYFPEEILIQILVKVPAGRVWLCRAVCRRWNSVISSPHFRNLHNHLHLRITIDHPLNHHNHTNQISFITFTTTRYGVNALGIYEGGLGFEGKKRRKMRVRRIQFPLSRADLQLKQQNQFDYLILIGSGDGLLMFDKFHGGFNWLFPRCWILVLTPFTREKRLIEYPGEGRNGYVCGFFFDRYQHEYNLLHVSITTKEYHIFSFAEGVWRQIQITSPSPSSIDPVVYGLPPCMHTSPPVLVADALHWIVDYYSAPLLYKRVMAFKIETKEIHYCPPPAFCPQERYITLFGNGCNICSSEFGENEEEKMQLIEKNGKLCFCHMINRYSRIDIWMLEEYGNWSSWVMRFKVVFPPDGTTSSRCLPTSEWGPTILSFPDEDVIAVKWNHNNIYLYHLITHESTSINDERMFRLNSCNFRFTAFNKTLLSPNILQ